MAGAEHGHKGAAFGKLGGSPKKKEGYNEPGKLYAAQRESGGPIKVGITKHLSQRISQLSKTVGEPVRLLGAVDVEDMGTAEAAVLRGFAGCADGEWISAEWGAVEHALRGQARGPNQPPFHPAPAFASAFASAEETEERAERARAAAESDGFQPSRAGLLCRAMREQAGFAVTNPGDLRFAALVEQGITEAECVGLAAECVDKGKGWAWFLDVLPKRRAEAGTLRLAPVVSDPMAWRKTELGVRRMSQQLGVGGPREGEMFEAWDRRVLTAWQRAGEPAMEAA
jgi:hypothetical protein